MKDIKTRIVVALSLLFLFFGLSYGQSNGKGFVALSVRDAEAIQQWYCENLGFKITKPLSSVAENVTYGVLERDGMVIELISRKSVKKKGEECFSPTFKFGYWVTDLTAHLNFLATKSVIPRHKPFEFEMEGKKIRSFIIEDPEGTLIQFFQNL